MQLVIEYEASLSGFASRQTCFGAKQQLKFMILGRFCVRNKGISARRISANARPDDREHPLAHDILISEAKRAFGNSLVTKPLRGGPVLGWATG
jgi:hypothetical protein